MEFKLSYQDEKKKGLQRLEVLVLIILLPLALYGVHRSHQSWKAYQEAESLLKSAQYLMHHEQYSVAAEELRRAVVLCPELFAAWADLAASQHLLGEHESELGTYQEALTHMPERFELHLGLAESYREMGQHDLELKQLAILRELRPEDTEIVDRMIERAEKSIETKSESPENGKDGSSSRLRFSGSRA